VSGSDPVAGAPLLACLFHLNLAFSSLPVAGRPAVIERCYWPMLGLPERTGFPIAIEASSWTLGRIAELDPAWIIEAKRLLDAGRIELVAGGRAQCALPLLPATAGAWNIRLGLDDVERLFGVRPRIALLGEQAYAPGLVALYAEAGVEAVIADWDNAARSHPDWPAATAGWPQRARGTDAELPVIWSESMVFQRFQRHAHGELGTAAWIDGIRARAAGGAGALLLYANDAEVFDHRPGRFAAEPPPGDGEWDRIATGLGALADGAGGGAPALPSAILGLLDAPAAGASLRLESAAHPVPVKKQDKYNVARWAVTGRDDVGINTRCERLLRALEARGERDPAAWRALCELWASDLRTHITEERWAQAQQRLAATEAAWRAAPPEPSPSPPARPAALPPGVTAEGTLWHVEAGDLRVTLNARRGLAVHAFRDLRVADVPLLGTLEHGFFPTIALGADWYTGNTVQEPPAQQKVTDLGPCEPVWAALGGGAVRVWGTVATPYGDVEKVLTIDPADGTLELDVTLRWDALPAGSLRAGHVTLHPGAFDPGTLRYATHNGGRALERHALGGEPVDHGAAVSSLVSVSQGLGMTEGVALLGDARRHVRIAVDRAVAAPLGLVTYTPLRDTFFLRLSLSLAEHDDTRRGPIPRPAEAPQRLRMRVSAATGPA
jgi:hypothetical protein